MTLIGITLALAVAALPATAEAAPAHDPSSLHVLARTLVAEADWHGADYAPIAYVLERRHRLWTRAGNTGDLGHFAQMYSALWRADSYRASTIRLLPWSAWAGPWGGARWDRVRAWVHSWARGEVRDPCPKAMHWGGTMDTPRLGWFPVDCGRTRNIFYTVGPMVGDR